MKILIVEDEHDLVTAAQEYLGSEGYICEAAVNFKEGADKISKLEYDCVIIDIGLPGGSGLQLVEELRSRLSQTGVIIISARNSLDDKINGLDLGADDYLTKPFHLSELNARVKSILRRRQFSSKHDIEFNEISVLPDRMRVTVAGVPVTVTKKEFDLLVYFIANNDKIVTKESIVEHLWPDYVNSADSYDFVYTHVSNLRKKLVENGARDYVRTVYGVGYRFTDA